MEFSPYALHHWMGLVHPCMSSSIVSSWSPSSALKCTEMPHFRNQHFRMSSGSSSQDFDTQLIICCMEGCFRLPAAVRVAGCLRHSSVTLFLNGALTETSLGWQLALSTVFSQLKKIVGLKRPVLYGFCYIIKALLTYLILYNLARVHNNGRLE